MVLIVSANTRLRKGWIRSLKERFPIQEAGDRAALEKIMTSRKPSVLLLDLALPRMNGVGGLRAIQALCPSTKIILFARTPDDNDAIKALKAGAKGYCSKSISPALLPKVMDVAQKGEIWAGRKVISRFVEELTSLTEQRRKEFPLKTAVSFDCLTPREHQIASQIGDGSSNKEIANELKISEKTVKAHLTAVFRKTGISDRLRLALFVSHDQQNGPEKECLPMTKVLWTKH